MLLNPASVKVKSTGFTAVKLIFGAVTCAGAVTFNAFTVGTLGASILIPILGELGAETAIFNVGGTIFNVTVGLVKLIFTVGAVANAGVSGLAGFCTFMLTGVTSGNIMLGASNGEFTPI